MPDRPTRSDGELARDSQAGSLEAFDELATRYESRVLAFIRRICPCEADALEVTQESFLKAFRALSQFDPDRSFAPWLFAIARRCAIDFLRAAPPPGEPVPEHLPAAADVLADIAARDDLANLWSLARRCLPPGQFQVLWLTYVEDFGVADTAAVMRLTRPHVKILLFRARRKLRQHLAHQAAPPAPFHIPAPSSRPTPDTAA